MRIIFSIILVCLLTSCGTANINRYEAAQPKLDLEDYFIGTTDAWGMFQQRDGEVIKRFQVVIEGKKEAGQLVLDERFTYSDGTTQQRIWRLQKIEDGKWRGTADDVKGDAIGIVVGNTLNWRYTLLLPVDGKVIEVSMDDWMYLIDENTIINRTSMQKFGIEVGQVTIAFCRRIACSKR